MIDIRRTSSVAAPLALALALCLMPSPARADIVYSVSFDDPGAAYSSYYSQITSHTLAAGADWAGHLSGSASLEVIVRFSGSIPRATGRSFSSSFLETAGVTDYFEQGAAAEIRTGIDPNGSAPDIELVFNPDYLANELWFDPDPTARLAPVPTDRTDAATVLLHELGHAFAFNGFRDQFDGTFPGNYQSTYDRQTTFDGTNFYFTGAHATALYGGPIALTYGNIFHLGNNAPRPGADLIPDLMNGVVFFRGQRYGISQLDLAVLADSGLNVIGVVPEPSSLALLALGAFGLAVIHKRTRRRRDLASPSDRL